MNGVRIDHEKPQALDRRLLHQVECFVSETVVPDRDLLGDKHLAFSDHLVYTRLCAPDKYPSEGITDLEHDFAQLHARWDALKGTLKRDVDKIPLIEQLLNEALDAYRAGDRSKGIAAIKSIESMKPQKLR